jgi:hypothetical protein
MNQLTNRLLAAAAVVLIVQTLMTTGAGHALARDIQAVLVTNTPSDPVPVAVQGTANIAGTIGVDPARNVVRVASSAADPLLVRDADDAQQPFQRGAFVIVAAGASNGSQRITVPPGKRLVLEYVSFLGLAELGQTLFAHLETHRSGSQELSALLTLSPGGRYVSGNDSFTANQQLRLYVDGGAEIACFVSRAGGSDQAQGQFVLSGYLVDLP